jgi:membrane protein implicated in regulation of membrane protease activity
VLLLIAIILAFFVLPSPWDLVAIIVGAVLEVGEALFWWRYTQRRKASVGAETLVGREGTVMTPCRPRGQVRVFGEIWDAICTDFAATGEPVVVRSVDVDGLTLVVERAEA